MLGYLACPIMRVPFFERMRHYFENFCLQVIAFMVFLVVQWTNHWYGLNGLNRENETKARGEKILEIRPIKKKRIYQEIIDQVKAAIVSGKIQPGDKLPSERTLAEKFQVSRTTIKEAMTVMEAMGLIEIRTGVGTFLREVNSGMSTILDDIFVDNETFIRELVEFRQAVEVDSAYYAAIRGTDEDKKILWKKFEEMEQAVSQQKLSTRSDYSFHMQIAYMSGNTLFMKAMEQISDHLFKIVTKNSINTLAGAGNPASVLEEHRAIFKAIQNGDGMTARKAMRHHLDSVVHRYQVLGLLIRQYD